MVLVLCASPPSLRLYIPPWQGGSPAAGDVVRINIVDVHGAPGLALDPDTASFVNGAPISSLADDGDGWYSLSHTVAAGEEAWPWTGLHVTAHLVTDGGQRVSLEAGSAPGTPFTEEGVARGISETLLRTSAASLEDVDSDGDLDFMVTSDAIPDSIPRLYVNNGSGHFSLEDAERLASRGLNFTTFWLPLFADVDNTGTRDIVLWNGLFLNAGDGTFSRTPAVWDDEATSTFARDSCVADFDGDGFVDLAALFSTSFRVYLSSSGATLYPASDSGAMSCVDFDHDGDVDVFSVSGTLWVNDGAGAFADMAAAVGLSGASGDASFWVDIDNNGWLDLWVTRTGASAGNQLYIQTGAGGFVEESGPRGLNTSTEVTVLAAVDFDNDGDLDVFNGGGWSAQAGNQLWVNVGGYFVEAASVYGFDRYGYSTRAVSGDLDNDGSVDIVVGTSGSNGIDTIFINHAGGHHSPRPYLRIRALSAQGAATAFGGTVTVTSHAWVVTQAIDSGLADNCKSAYDVHVAVPDPLGVYDIVVRYPGGGVANKTTHPGLGNVCPGCRRQPTLLVFGPGAPPPPMIAVQRVGPAPREPRLGDGVNITVTATGGVAPWVGLEAVSITVNGANVTATMVEASLPGTYTFTWVLAAGGDLLWPYAGLNTSIVFRDPVSGAVGGVAAFEHHPGVAFARRLDTELLPPGAPSVATRTVSIADANGDGHLDVYTLVGDGANRLFVSDGSGGFSEVAAEYGVAIVDACTCASVADVDNDGDVDMLLGRADNTTLLLTNRGGASGFLDAVEVPPVAVNRLVVADLDGDGDVDAFVQRAAGAPLLLLNTGGGVFVESGSHGITQSAPGEALSSADLDADGDVDVVLLAAADPTLFVFINDGLGAFTRRAGAQAPGLVAAHAVSVGDVDGDGDVDVWVATAGGGDVFLLNDGSASFVEASPGWGVGPASGVGRGALLCDVDQDGFLDVLAGALLYDGSGAGFVEDGAGFGVSVDHPLGQAAGDLDGDRSVDVWVACGSCPDVVLMNAQPADGVLWVRVLDARGMRVMHGATVRVRPSDSSSWQAMRVVDCGHGLGAMSAYDVHVAVPAPHTTYSVEVMAPTGRWNSTTHPGLAAVVPAGMSPRLIVVRPPPSVSRVTVLPPTVNPADGLPFPGVVMEARIVEAAGASDLIVAAPGHLGGLPAAFTALGGGEYALQVGSTSRTWPWDGVVVEVVLAQPDGGVGQLAVAVSVTVAPGVQFSQEAASRADFGGAGVCVGDVNGDGFGDFVVSMQFERPALWLNDGEGVFAEAGAEWGLFAHVDFRSAGCAFADADDDGDVDLAIAGFDSSSQVLFLNTGSGFVDATAERGVQTAGSARSVTWCDIDGDRATDLMVNAEDELKLFVNREGGAGSAAGYFTEQGSLRGVSGAVSPANAEGGAACFDSNDDGALDILLFPQTHNAVPYFTNTGSGQFSDASAHIGGAALSNVWGFAVGDVDGDGDLDVAVAQLDAPLALLVNNGAGAFSTSLVGEASVGATRGCAVGDMDLDGVTDVVTSSGGGRQRLYRGAGGGEFHEDGLSFGFAAVGAASGFVLVDIDSDGDGDTLSKTAVYVNHHARATVPNWVKVRPLTAAGGWSAFGAVVRILCVSCAEAWRAAHTVDGGSSYYSQSGYDAVFGVPNANATYNVTVRWPGDAYPRATWASHPLLGSLRPAWRSAAQRLLTVRPAAVQLVLGDVSPWDYAAVSTRATQLPRGPVAGDTHTVPVLTSPPAVGLVVAPGAAPTVNGGPAVLVEDGGGAYHLTFTTAASDTAWPWAGLQVRVSLQDSAGLVSELQVDGVVAGVTLEEASLVRLSGSSMARAHSVCFGDIDGDGAVDVFVLGPETAPLLFINDGTGVFNEEAAGRGVHDAGFPGAAVGCAIGDVNGDGRSDMFVALRDGAPNLLFMNTGGSFVEDAAARLVNTTLDSDDVMLADVDGDLDVDVFVTAQESALLYINGGAGVFSEEAALRGLGGIDLPPRAAAFVDVAGDGSLDLLVATLGGDLALFVSRGAGTFVDEHSSRGFSSPAASHQSMAVADFVGGDGALDVFITRDSAHNLMFAGDGSGNFADVSEAAGFVDVARTIGCAGIDLELDGDVDLLVGVFESAQPLLINDGARFVDRSEAVAGLNWGGSAEGVAAGDFDGDGDLDVFMPFSNKLFVNHNAHPAVNNSLSVRALSTAGLRTAFGGTVRCACVTLCTWVGVRVVDGGTSYHGQNAYDAHFGVPDSHAAYNVTVAYPGGAVADFTSHPGLGSVVPATRPSRLLALRGPGQPDPMQVQAAVEPWDTTVKPAPEAGDVVVVRVEAVGGVAGWQGLVPLWGDVNGGAAGAVVEVGGPGEYHMPWVVGEGDGAWPWAGLNVTVGLLDPVSGVSGFVSSVLRPGASFTEEAASRLIEKAGTARYVALADYDGDGDVDMLSGPEANGGAINDGAGFFLPAPPSWGFLEVGSSADLTPRTVVFGDVDADGDVDLVAARWTATVFATNTGAAFEVASSNPFASTYEDALGVCLADFDGDGDLDVFVADNRLHDRLFIRAANGSYSEEAASRGISHGLQTMRPACVDFDLDGDVDIHRPELNYPDSLYRNNGEGSFVNVAHAVGLNLDALGQSSAWGDVDGNGLLDVVIPLEPNVGLFVQLPGVSTFQDVTAGSGLDIGFDGVARAPPLLFDCDHDGDLDVFVSIDGDRDRLLANTGDAHFVEQPLASTGASPSRGAAVGDMDGDGDLDIVAVLYSLDSNFLFVNHNSRPGVPDSLFVRPLTLHGTRLGSGTVVRVADVGGTWQAIRLISPSSSSQSSYDAHFGLPSAAVAFNIEVVFVGGGGSSGVANRITHAGLGGVTPAALPSVADRTVVVRPRPSLSVRVLPWDFPTFQRQPAASDVATLQVVEAHGVEDLVLESGVVGGQPVVSMQHQGGGVYVITYTTGDDVEWPWAGLSYDLVLQLGEGLGQVVERLAGHVVPGVVFSSDDARGLEFPGNGQALCVGDLNGDGFEDVLVSLHTSGAAAAVLENDGSGAFTAVPSLEINSVFACSFADFNADGQTDILLSRFSSPVLQLLLAAPPPAPAWTFNDSTTAWGLDAVSTTVAVLVAGDVLGSDGLPDVTVMPVSGVSTLLRNVDGLRFVEAAGSTFSGVAMEASSAVSADFNRDGLLDVFGANYAGANVLYLGRAGGAVEDAGPRGVAAPDVRSSGCAAGDVDGDGFIDLFVGVYAPDTHQLFMNDGDGHFVEAGAQRGVVGGGSRTTRGVLMCDIDLDGDDDIFVLTFSTSSPNLAFVNDGGGYFMELGEELGFGGGSTGYRALVSLDFDADGDLDLLGASLQGDNMLWVSHAAVGATPRTVVVKVEDRLGRAVLCGSTVTLSDPASGWQFARSVDCGGGYASQSTGSVYFGVPDPTAAYDVVASLIGGRTLSKHTLPALGGITPAARPTLGDRTVVARDVPAVSAIRVLPATGDVGVGGHVEVDVVAVGEEPGLLLARGHVNGHPVAATAFHEAAGGVYSMAYTVGAGHGDWEAGGLSFSLVLVDGYGVESAPYTAASVLVSPHGLLGDSTPPVLDVTCRPEAVSPTPLGVVCLACPVEPRGCHILYTNGTGGPQNATMDESQSSARITVGPAKHGEEVAVVAWAVDAVGNVGPNTTVAWVMDLESPVTTITTAPPALTNDPDAQFSFACSEAVCLYSYNLNGGPLTPVGGDANATHVDDGEAHIETVVVAAPPRFHNQTRARFQFAAAGQASVVANSTVEVSLFRGSDAERGQLVATVAAVNATFEGLQEGPHWVQAVAVGGEGQVDVTPVWYAFTVDTTPPGVAFVQTPAPDAGVASAFVAFVATQADCVYFVRWGAASAVNESHPAWVHAGVGAVQVDGMRGGEAFAVEVFAVDPAGNAGAVARREWVVADCVEAVPAVAATQSISLGSGVRHISVEAAGELGHGIEYSVDGGDWLASDTPSAVLLSGLAGGRSYTVGVRAGVTASCAAVWEGRRPPPAEVTWYEPSQAGTASVLSGPEAASPRVFATFELETEASLQWLEYAVDGGPWAPTLVSLRIGPLPPGVHTLSVRTVGATGGALGPVAVYDWRVTSAGSSTVVLAGLPDGSHTLVVTAVDDAGRPEVVPKTHTWAVDTQPPTTNATLASPRFTTEREAVVDLACGGEARADLCEFCWAGVGGEECTVEPRVELAVDADGDYEAVFRAQDGAGNVDGRGAVVEWRVDATPPNTTLSPVSDLRPVAASTHDFVTAVATVRLLAGATEAVRGYMVAVNGGDAVLFESSELVFEALNDQPYGIHVWGVDLAGNVDTAGVLLRVLIDTVAPVLRFVEPPPALTNASDVAFEVAELADVPAMGTVTYHIVVGGGAPPQTSTSPAITLHGLPTGTYNVSVFGEDAAGNVGVALVHVVRVDLTPPTTSILGPPTRIVASNTFAVATAASEEGVAVSGRLVGVTGWLPGNASGVVGFHAPDGVFVVEVRGLDAAGNEEAGGALAHVEVTVDVLAPVLSWGDGKAPPVWTASAALRPCFRVEDLTAVEVEVGLTPAGTASLNHTDGCVEVGLAADGNYTLSVSGTDAAGNVAPALTSWSVLDRVPPGVRVLAVPSDASSQCVTRGNITVCPSASAVEVVLSCDGDVGSPCTPLHAVEVLERAGGEACLPARRLQDADEVVFVESGDGVPVTPSVPGDGLFRLLFKAVDGAGNVEATPEAHTVYVDSEAPPMAPTLVETPPKDTASTTATFRLQLEGDASPGQTAFWYTLDGQPAAMVTEEPSGDSNEGVVDLVLAGLELGSHVVEVWARDQAGNEDVVNAAAFYTWFIADTAPSAYLGSGPANVSGDATPSFTIQAVWPVGGLRSGVEVGADIQVRVGAGGDWEQACAPFTTNATAGWCTFTAALTTTGTFTLSARAVFAGRAGEEATYLWTYTTCGEEEYAVLGSNQALSCRECPDGGDCRGGLTSQADLVAQADWWAPGGSSGLRYYACPIPGACLPGRVVTTGNTTLVERGRCAVGYMGTLCAVCEDGFFEQFGECTACSASSGLAWVVVLAVVLVVVAVGVLFFKFRDALPLDELKVGCSMVQIIASANTAYAIPWPPLFRDFANALRVFLVEAVSLTRASCAQPMSFYDGLAVTFLAFKIVLVVIVLGPVAWHKWQHRRLRSPTPVPAPSKPHPTAWRRSSISAAVGAALLRVQAVPWPRIFRTCFLFLFVTYPGLSLKVMKTFKCVEVEGQYWLAADMRLKCYEGDWFGYALYAFVMGCVFTAGLPLAITVILWRNRKNLANEDVVAKWGFLYEVYGVGAYLWEVEELLRKLWLSALVVLMEEGSPLQVTTAVLVSFWAHILHGVFKPWAATTYALQHLSLFVTSFVFLMGLLFKVDGVSQDGGTFTALAYLMVALCLAFVVAWLLVAGVALAAKVRHVRRAKIQRGPSPHGRHSVRTQVVQWMTDSGEGGPGPRQAASPTAVRRVHNDKAWTQNPLRSKGGSK